MMLLLTKLKKMNKNISIEKNHIFEVSFSSYLNVLKNKLPDFEISFEIEHQDDLSVCFNISYLFLNEHIEKEFLRLLYSH